MARVYRTIESLKSLKSELVDKGITRFKSVREIKDFLKNFNSEKLTILNDISDELDKEYSKTCSSLKQKIQNKVEAINLETERIDSRISDLQTKIDLILKKNGDNFLKKIISSLRLYYLKKESKHFLNNKTKLISLSAKELSNTIGKDKLFIEEYKTDRQLLIKNRVKLKIEKLEYICSVLESSKNLISGAIGENLVVKEIKKLSDDYVLINDFKLNFSPPIFYKQQNERIYSIQIDHLLISKAGIFIIETKNWSKKSINSISLRSPIEQIRRSNFALYTYISKNISLDQHHWGEQKIPIRNLIVMINNKPNTQFKYVSIKLLRELNDYIKYFEPILTEKQVNNITTQLI
ncbi:hypothetical protein LCGC14_0166790 [marine sediment metagenome]|uniref:NERD domain-containing protein n=1 Tax=marine sediment metagenome TaxID=412755 RepID=A0A0F9XWA5_9ZZZZ|nr:nuclease-related domain-containing protein [Maribacter sp.]HDZ07084.1 NERD domain-containing protein [Maribacter sp.]